MREEIGAVGFFECSARMGEGVTEIFEACAKVLLKGAKKTKRQRMKGDCQIL